MKVFLWTNTIDNLYAGKGNIGGIAIQMSFWAKTFLKKGHQVFSLSSQKSTYKEGIKFYKLPNVKKIAILIELIYSLIILIRNRPNLIIVRGADRNLSYLSIYSRLVGAKLLFFGASDNNFKPGEELIVGNYNKKLYRFGLRRVQNIVLQNEKQKELLEKNYGKKKCCVIPNIWIKNSKPEENINKDIDFLWVGNFRGLKRPRWFINLAKSMPQYKFCMVGAVSDKQLYEECANTASNLQNLDFKGGLPFEEVNKLFARARCDVCTSEIEGFPNTFLQAWSNNIPVISSFDASNLIQSNNLGIFINNEEELKEAAVHLITHENTYKTISSNIKEYFDKAHNPEYRYEEIINLIQ